MANTTPARNGNDETLRGVTIGVVEHSTETFVPPNLASVFTLGRIADNEAVTESLVMAFEMIMRGKLFDRFS